ncbi:site-specific integrase [Solibacillus sp. FSL K6-1781]|uniref:tyrosine-type recombinase/integrase n=1 Tax=Solibacillus sp. FSL K6-1781 TaxID=2921474 RepID=UPI00315A5400
MASLRKRNNKWEYRIRVKNKQTGEWGEHSKGGFVTKKEAALAAGKAEIEYEYFGFVENGKETIGHYLPAWFELYKRPSLAESTSELQWRVIEKNILPRWGNYSIKDIERNEYRKWLVELKKQYSEGTLRRIHSIFNSAMHDAVTEFKIIRENPLARTKVPTDKKELADRKLKFFTVTEMKAFLDAAKIKVKNSKYKDSNERYVLYSLLCSTGLRIGEALALEWKDIDFATKMLTVNKTVYYANNSKVATVSSTKTTSSERIIQIDDELIQLLKYHRINQNQMHLLYPASRPKDVNGKKLPLLFHNWSGTYWRANVIRDHFTDVCKRADVPLLSPHALRHSHAVHLLEAGASIKYVSSRLGHKTTKTTADTYLHITKKIEQDALDLYKNHLKNTK